MVAVYILVASFAFLGHLALWTMIHNRTHSAAIPHRVGRQVNRILRLAVLAIPLYYVGYLAWEGAELRRLLFLPRLALAYLLLCCIVIVYVTTKRAVCYFRNHRRLTQLISDSIQRVDVAEAIGARPLNGSFAQLLGRVPGNQIWNIHVQQKELQVANLPPQLDGFSIAHVSDFHFSGRIGREFYEEVVNITQDLQADLIAITGDYLDHLDCLPWIPDVLGKLTSPHGSYFVMGNHDKRFLEGESLRQEMEKAGLINLGGRWTTVDTDNGELLLAGNELPWFEPAADMSKAPNAGSMLRILLSHSPDQIKWAQRHQFDLMLAGHTHGGQIRFPLIGAVVCPSNYGAEFAAGTYYLAPTLLHVTRGVSGKTPIRLHCPPEITKLVLRG